MVGDQQSALFGQACFSAGEAKCTYGTGCFLLMNTGKELCLSRQGLLTTIAVGIGGQVRYALEGSVFMGGALMQWLRDEVGILPCVSDAGHFAREVPDNGGVYIVPAFTGLGAPYWDMYARGTILGLTRGAGAKHIIRAAEEAIAYQVFDLVRAMELDTGICLRNLKVDGGASQDDFLLQFQADILRVTAVRGDIRETTGLGAAWLAGLWSGAFESEEELSRCWREDVEFSPALSEEKRTKLLGGWQRAVSRSRDWLRDPQTQN
jgi:glycerol kinase